MSRLRIAKAEEPSPTRRAAINRIRRAMQKVEAAQNLLGEACGEICAVKGASSEWRHIGRLYDRAKLAWHRLEAKLSSDQVDLDDSTKARLREVDEN